VRRAPRSLLKTAAGSNHLLCTAEAEPRERSCNGIEWSWPAACNQPPAAHGSLWPAARALGGSLIEPRFCTRIRALCNGRRGRPGLAGESPSATSGEPLRSERAIRERISRAHICCAHAREVVQLPHSDRVSHLNTTPANVFKYSIQLMNLRPAREEPRAGGLLQLAAAPLTQLLGACRRRPAGRAEARGQQAVQARQPAAARRCPGPAAVGQPAVPGRRWW
jgi:hypothetical protein